MRIFLPLHTPNGAADLHQHLFGQAAGGIAEMVEDSGGGKLHNTGQVLVLQVVRRVQAAAGQKGELDAGGQQGAKPNLQIQVIQFLQ